jgi:predicted house-cleaning NTP pyrophosphatase (Maf/HAM1 superfamily)
LEGRVRSKNANIPGNDWNYFCVTRVVLRKLSNKQINFWILSSGILTSNCCSYIQELN